VSLVPTEGAARTRRTTTAVLNYAHLSAGDPMARLLILLCDRYGLDPLLGHAEIIKRQGERKLYITRDGYLDIGHRQGVLDGFTIEDVHHGESGIGARVYVWRKDCAHPFEGRAGCGFDERKDDPEAMAITRAQRRALRSALHVPVDVDEQWGAYFVDEDAPEVGDAPPARGDRAAVRGSAPVASPSNRQAEAHKAVGMLADDERAAFLARFGIEDFGSVWPDDAIDHVLGEAQP
jgi:hypothetical protein